MATKYVEVTYPSWMTLEPIVHPVSNMQGDILRQRLEGGCTVTPLVVMTPERVSALEFALLCVVGSSEARQHSETIQDMLDEARGE